MAGINTLNDESHHLSDFNMLQSKIREKFFELGLKRKLLGDHQVALRNLDSEKHAIIQKFEKAERELSDVNIHLQVAIKAAREAEAERSTARELMARQTAQLEAATKEREFLQQANREIQLDFGQMKRELDDNKSKMLSQSHFLDLIKKKDSQNKATIEALTLETCKLEKSQSELRRMCAKITHVTKTVNSLIILQKKELADLRKEKLEFQEKLMSLNAQAEEAEEKKSRNQTNDAKLNVYPQWELNQIEMKKRLKNAEEENLQLQASLNQALLTSTKFQATENMLTTKIRALEEELEKSKQKHLSSFEHKETQTSMYDDRTSEQGEITFKT